MKPIARARRESVLRLRRDRVGLSGVASASDRRVIAFVCDAVFPFNTGGKETRLHQITQRLAAEGHDIHIYTMKWWEGASTIRLDGVWFHALMPRLPLYSGDRRSTRQAILFGLATLRLLTKPFDVLDVDHMPFFPLFSAKLVCSLRRKRLYGTWHEVWGRSYWHGYMGVVGIFGHATEQLAIRLPDVIISNSQHTTDRLRRVSAKLCIQTVPLGVDFEHIKSIGPSSTSYDVIYAGRLISHKNVNVLIEAIALLGVGAPPPRCLIVGEGPERANLERLAVKLGVSASVDFLDFRADQDDLFALMKSSKVFVLPSEREGFGLVVLEANACGLPVVTVGGEGNAAQDLIVAGENGFTVSLDAEGLAKGIRCCLAQQSGLRPLETVSRRFADHDWSAVAARIAAILLRPDDGTRAPVDTSADPPEMTGWAA